jgi:hypothetical protein
LNKECQSIADSSFLWLSCDLSFHASKRYLEATDVWKPPFVGSVSDFLQHDSTYINSRIFNATNFLTLFDERKFNFQGSEAIPSAFTITVYLPHNDFVHLSMLEKADLALKVRTWFVRLFVSYHRLWHWHTRWYPVLSTFSAYIGSFIQEYVVFFVIISLLSLFFCIYCLFSINSSLFLSFYNHIGFILLLVNLFVLLIILIGYLLTEIIKYYTNVFLYLRQQWNWIDMTFPVILILISMGSFTGLLLSYLHLSDILPLGWSTIVMIMWGCFLLATVAAIFELFYRVHSRMDKILRIGILYSLNAVPASCLLASLFSYSSRFSSNYSNGLIVLIPVFPLIVMSIIGGIQVSLRCKRCVDYYLIFILRNNKLHFSCCYPSGSATRILWWGRIIVVFPGVLVFCYFLLGISCFYLVHDKKPVYPFLSISPLISTLCVICCFEAYFILFYYIDLFFEHSRY